MTIKKKNKLRPVKEWQFLDQKQYHRWFQKITTFFIRAIIQFGLREWGQLISKKCTLTKTKEEGTWDMANLSD